ncbi:hypothetical protein ABZX12_14740 [Kribbella sp. NPDC003505]|uniref:helix-turn-helix transcriptional regulator n=1 Tax=Kribbella sp. NPDC003505 TaxID=3154448 RepID=UPI0033BBEB00
MTTTHQSAVDLLGMHEIANLLGVTRPRAWQLRAATDFPAPVARIGGRDYFAATAIGQWMADNNRQPHRTTTTERHRLS